MNTLNNIRLSPEQFCYWLQGYFEIMGEQGSLNQTQYKKVKEHLEMVFNHVPKPIPHSDIVNVPYHPVTPQPVYFPNSEPWGVPKNPQDYIAIC